MFQMRLLSDLNLVGNEHPIGERFGVHNPMVETDRGRDCSPLSIFCFILLLAFSFLSN